MYHSLGKTKAKNSGDRGQSPKNLIDTEDKFLLAPFLMRDDSLDSPCRWSYHIEIYINRFERDMYTDYLFVSFVDT